MVSPSWIESVAFPSSEKGTFSLVSPSFIRYTVPPFKFFGSAVRVISKESWEAMSSSRPATFLVMESFPAAWRWFPTTTMVVPEKRLFRL